MELEDKIKKLQDKRVRALNNHDALQYYKSCQELGISGGDIEDHYLYNRGEGDYELGFRRSIGSSLSRASNQKNNGNYTRSYNNFYDEVKSMDINAGKFEANPHTKKALLLKYFPKVFGEGRKQDLGNYSDGQVGHIFKKILDYSAKRVQDNIRKTKSRV